MLEKKSLNFSIRQDPLSYELLIGENLLEDAYKFAKSLSSHTLIITSDAIDSLIRYNKTEKLILPSGEIIKSRAMKEKIEDALIERGWGKDSCLLAIGGGALLDLVGFVAATYCRGIPYISVPSTLLAMTDAAIGGKTAVNVEEAKNWIGAFHHPSKVFIDLNLLKTLPEREFFYGLAESIKHSLIADKDLFSFLEHRREALLQQKGESVQELILRSCLVKKRIIEMDPFEKTGARRQLNFGHTIGHALETLSDYRLSHGQAVLMGMRVEAEMASLMDYFPRSHLERFDALLKSYSFKLEYPAHLSFELMQRDKKGAHQFVVLTSIGSVAPFEGSYSTCFFKSLFERAWNNVVCHNQKCTC